MNAKRVVQVAASLCFILIVIALVAIRNSPATGYESSIYWSTPPLVWGCLLFSIACGIAIIVYEAYRKDERSNLWVIGFILILLGNTVILSLHILRGYAMWNGTGDSGWHLGTTQDIITAGHFARSELFYPITHIHLAQLSQVLDISPVTLMKWVPVFFALLYMVFMYFLAKSLLHGKSQVILATAAATALISCSCLILTPFWLASLAFPLVLFLLFRSFSPGAWQWRALFILTLCLFPVFHQITTVALAIMLLTIPLARLLSAKLAQNGRKLIDGGLKFSMVALLILFAWAGLWLFPSMIGVSSTLIPEDAMILQTEGPLIPSQLPEGVSHLTTLTSQINYAQYYGYSVAVQFFKVYGDLLVYILLALIALPILWRGIRSRADIRDLASLYGPLAAIALLIVALFFTAVYFGPTRFLVYIAMICTILGGFTLYKFIDWATSRHGKWIARIVAFFVAVFLVGVSMNSILKAYPSPYTLSPSYQTTQAEIDGMDWFLHNKDTGMNSSGWYYAPYRYAAFLLTPEEREQRGDFLGNVTLQIPFHLGYDKYPTMGQSFEEDTHVVLRELNRRVYVDVFPRMADLRLLPSDFAKMENDPSLDKLYDNGGLEIWYLHATN